MYYVLSQIGVQGIPAARPWKVARQLTHWGRVTHICVSKLTIICSDNGLSPDRCQAIIWTNAGLLLIGPLGTNFSEILIEILTFSFKTMHLKLSSAKVAAILSRGRWVNKKPLTSCPPTAEVKAAAVLYYGSGYRSIFFKKMSLWPTGAESCLKNNLCRILTNTSIFLRKLNQLVVVHAGYKRGGPFSPPSLLWNSARLDSSRISAPSWRRHDMETLSSTLTLCEGKPLVAGGFSSQTVRNAEFVGETIEQSV